MFHKGKLKMWEMMFLFQFGIWNIGIKNKNKTKLGEQNS